MRISILLAAMLATVTTASAETTARPDFSVGAIADAQFAAEPDAPPRLYHTAPGKLTAAVADFDRQKLAFVVHLGDFIDKDWASFDTMLPIAHKSRHPWHFVLGNHEFAIPEARKPELPAKLGMPARYYAFTQGQWRFLVTDGNDISTYGWPEGSAEQRAGVTAHDTLYPAKPTWDGGLGEAQMRWIEAQLTEADKKGQKVALLCHFPVFPENKHNLWNAEAVMALIERHPSVKLWLDGHNHEGNYGIHAGVHYLNLKAMLDTDETAYSRLDFFKDRIELHGTGREQDRVMPLR